MHPEKVTRDNKAVAKSCFELKKKKKYLKKMMKENHRFEWLYY